MTFLYQAHSGLRYLVLLAALGAVVSLAYALANGRVDRSARVLPMAFTGLLDLQVLLGVGLVVGGVFPDAAVGHLVMMVLALVVTHGASVMGKRASTERRELSIRLVGIVLAMLLVAAGIMALGRSVLGTAPMDVGWTRSKPYDSGNSFLPHEHGSLTAEKHPGPHRFAPSVERPRKYQGYEVSAVAVPGWHGRGREREVSLKTLHA